MKPILKLFWTAGLKLTYEGGLAIASNVAISLLLSLFPFLMLIAGLVQWWGTPELADDVVNLIFQHWPEDAAKPIADQVRVDSLHKQSKLPQCFRFHL